MRARKAIRMLMLVAVFAGLAVVASPAQAGQRQPFLNIHSAAGLAPDSRSITVELLASCPLRWTVAEAFVTVSQPEASGRASFTIDCIDHVRPITVTVPSSGGSFVLGRAQVNASMVLQRGRTQRVDDAELVYVQPIVHVDLADTARLESGGAAVVIGVTVACPVGATGLATSYVNVSQGQAGGSENYLPVCDGRAHTLNVRVPAALGVFAAGAARSLTFADVEHDGIAFSGVDDSPVTIVG
jgi:hypothetical protein